MLQTLLRGKEGDLCEAEPRAWESRGPVGSCGQQTVAGKDTCSGFSQICTGFLVLLLKYH